MPLESGGAESGVVVEGRPLPPPGTQGDMCLFQASSPDYLRAMGIPLVRGRAFTARDDKASTPVAIVDEALVRKLFPGEDPLGRRIAFEFRGDRQNPNPLWRESSAWSRTCATTASPPNRAATMTILMLE